MAKTGSLAWMSFDTESRTAEIDSFLAKAGWADAARHPLGQDASTRRYIRLVRDDGARAMLMDAPGVEDAPCPPDADEATRLAMGWNAKTRLAASRVDAFVALAGELNARGLSAPQILATDTEAGLALIEDFGEGREFARLIERGAADEIELYTSAAELLADLHSAPPPEAARGHGETWPILDFDALALRSNADQFADWMPKHDQQMRWGEAAAERWAEEREALIAQAMARPRVFTLRDYHAENLIWLPERAGKARIGLLDFQDAVRGWAAWDMSMLTQDARREVSPAAREAAMAAYCAASGMSREALEAELAIVGTLNALRIAGVFARLIQNGKPRYADFLPRQLEILARNLRHPDVSGMASLVRETAPHLMEANP
ncbi:MAG: phosphotransferase [Hyphomonadaceae bacterium]|nr:phosphotransferase [Hyphomonadaceae bacterium]